MNALTRLLLRTNRRVAIVCLYTFYVCAGLSLVWFVAVLMGACELEGAR